MQEVEKSASCAYLSLMRIRLSELKRIIRDVVLQEMGAPVASTLDDFSMRVLSKIARLRPLPQSALKPEELDVVDALKTQGFVAYDLASRGYTTTAKGLDALGRR